jgi:hypothetical protein
VSLQQSLKECHEHETKTKNELEEKHAETMSEMAEKLKTSNNRVKTLVPKLKAAEAEAADVDELIFRKDFMVPACPLYSFLPNSKSDCVIFCVYQRVSNLNGQKIPDFPGLEPMKKMISSKLVVALPGSCP